MESVTFLQVGIFVGCIIVALGLALTIKLLLQRDPPLHREFASQEQLEEVSKRVDRIDEKIEAGFQALRDERSRSTGNLHSRIEQLTTDLRKDMKAENDGLHNRITELLAAFSKLAGTVENAMKQSRPPFGK